MFIGVPPLVGSVKVGLTVQEWSWAPGLWALLGETGRAPDEGEGLKWTCQGQLKLLGGRHMVTPLVVPTRSQVAGSAWAAAL